MSGPSRRLDGLEVVVIGAGFGGLSAAAHLSNRGAKVTVLEAKAAVGGKAGHVRKDGYVFDTGPTLLTMPDVVLDTFEAAGVSKTELERRIPFTRIDPTSRYVWDDGAHIDVFVDDAKTMESIAKISPRDAAAWPEFRRACKVIEELAGEPYLEAPFESMFAFSRRIMQKGMKAAALGMTLGSLDSFASKHFESDKMRSFVGRFATYAGASPYEASAAFAMIVETELGGGAYYPKGGMAALAAALAEALRARGVSIRLETPAVRIVTAARNRTTGVVTRGGETLRADVVVCNVEPGKGARDLLGDAFSELKVELDQPEKKLSLSGFAWMLGVEGRANLEHHHTVLFAGNYREEFDAIFERGDIAEDPTLYVEVPSRDDDSRAPAGHDVLFVLANAPANAGRDDEAWRSRVVARMRRKLARHLGEEFFSRVRAEAFVGPSEIASTGATGGAIYARAPHGTLAPFERPRNRVAKIPGLYFAGGGTHPGGGVPLVMTSGRFVADSIEVDLGRRRIAVQDHERPRSAT